MDALMFIFGLAFFVAVCLASHVLGAAESQALITTVHSLFSGAAASVSSSGTGGGF